MKTLTKALIAVSASSLLAVSANAAISYGSSAGAQPYVGVKVGSIDADQVSGNAMAYGVYGGYNFDQNFGVEGELVRSEKKDFADGVFAREGQTKSYGVYGTYRYNFNNTPFYAKGKLGVSKTEVDVTGAGYSENSDQTGIAGGVGLGFKPNSNIGVEASYNYLSKDASMLGLGAHLAF